ncbi:hypothetical protein Cgig2_033646 [Carnegiea gigantea]|uniref:NAB domain-containing protein n=1 Tax=Carnegiea gigantea TaxID=171969 RepID=A0A9Q1JMG7_9CARY|nr:hypothetical protein Cgig2_033646 [Carnegiea gigantea]
MLHRAATTAYSWWWASHIRTKQLVSYVRDMEEKVKSMLKIIDQEGDSFAKRAEMYYKKRPELVNFVEESYKAYRSLAERFDHISKDLQSANRTIATVFPEQVQLDLESDDEDSLMGSTAPSPDRLSSKSTPPVPKNLPKAPKLPKPNNLKSQSAMASRREQLRKNLASGGPMVMSSGLSKEEAIKEIDVLQKDILSLQTEKEFVKSAYENALAKFLELENKVTESQTKVCSLQDEFGIGTVIEDHEARTLMADSALKSCEDALSKLQKEQEKSMEEVKLEYQKIKEAHERLEALKKLLKQDGEPEPGPEHESKPEEGSTLATTSFGDTFVNLEQEEGENINAFREKIKEQLQLTSDAFTAPEIADKIDDLVEKIISLETTICSLNALVKRLRQDVEALLAHIKSLEEQKQSMVGDAAIKGRLRELEEELIRVKRLNKEVVLQNNTINAEITKAGCNLEHLKEKLPEVEPDEDAEYLWLPREAKAEQEGEAQKEDIENEGERDEDDEEEKPEMSRTPEHTPDTDPPLGEQDGLDWRQLYLNNLEDREKILVEEYTIILRDYKNMKMKLSEMEKTNRDNNFELQSLIEELRNTIAAKDEEIQRLRRMLSALQNKANADVNANANASNDSNLEESKDSKQKDEQNDNDEKDDLILPSDPSKKPLFHHLYDRDAIIKGKPTDEDGKKSLISEGGERRVKINLVTKTRPVSRTEAKFRAELDNLLEANLDFWLRFSTSFHQIQKFQTSIKDLSSELAKLKEAHKKGDNDKSQQSAKSDARPLYKHLREIETELTLWLEHSAVFQEELRSRFSSLNNIQDDITKVSNANNKAEDSELSDYQAAKFQGEILNMKQENSKVAEELQAGVHRVKALKVEVGKALSKLDKDYGLLESKSKSYSLRNPMSRSKIPLRSLLFGMRLKRNKQKSSHVSSADPTLSKSSVSILEFPK